MNRITHMHSPEHTNAAHALTSAVSQLFSPARRGFLLRSARIRIAGVTSHHARTQTPRQATIMGNYYAGARTETRASGPQERDGNRGPHQRGEKEAIREIHSVKGWRIPCAKSVARTAAPIWMGPTLDPRCPHTQFTTKES